MKADTLATRITEVIHDRTLYDDYVNTCEKELLPFDASYLVFILASLLDALSKRPKFACPTCHRIVDKLINSSSYQSDAPIEGYKNQCKHCVGDSL